MIGRLACVASAISASAISSGRAELGLCGRPKPYHLEVRRALLASPHVLFVRYEGVPWSIRFTLKSCMIGSTLPLIVIRGDRSRRTASFSPQC